MSDILKQVQKLIELNKEKWELEKIEDEECENHKGYSAQQTRRQIEEIDNKIKSIINSDKESINESIEQRFFKCFNVAEQHMCNFCSAEDNKKPCKLYNNKSDCWFAFDKMYPPITMDVLLKIICIWNELNPCVDDRIAPEDCDNLKEKVLEKVINYSKCDYKIDIDILKQKIQSLFN